MVKYLLTILFCLLFFVPVLLSQKKTAIPDGEFEEQVTKTGVQVLDVRTAGEYAASHIKNSLQADWLDNKQFKERVQYLDKAHPVYVYCGSGVRSKDAAKWLRQEGFQQVFELQNGFISWKKNNRPVEIDSAVNQMSLTEYQALLKTSSVSLVDFGAKWCPPCKKMEPVLEQLQKDLSGKFTLIKVDAGVHTGIMQQLKVENIPTFILYKNGKETWRKNGLVSLEEFKSQLQ